MRWPLLVALAILALAAPCAAQVSGVVPAGTIQATNAIQGCGSNAAPVGTLTSATSVVSLPCIGAGSYEVRIVPTSGSPLVGTLTSNDLDLPAAPSSRTLYKNGVGALEIASDTLTGGTTPLTYRTCGGNNLSIGLSNYTSGSANVYITGSFATTLVCLNGSIDTREDRAVRNGKAYSAFVQGTVTAGQYMSLMLTDPLPAAGSVGTRVIFEVRAVACNNPTATTAPQWWALTGSQSNPISVNVPTTSLVTNKRGGNNAVASVTQLVGTVSATTYPDTTTSTPLANRPTGFAPTGGMDGGPGHVKRLLDPGMSTAITVLGVGTGLTGNANPTCKIDLVWDEEAVN